MAMNNVVSGISSYQGSTGTFVDLEELYETGHIDYDSYQHAQQEMSSINSLLDNSFQSSGKQDLFMKQKETYDDVITRLAVNELNQFSTPQSLQTMISRTAKQFKVARHQVLNDLDFKCQKLSHLFEGELD